MRPTARSIILGTFFSLLFSVLAFAQEPISLEASITDALKQHPQIKSLKYNREAVDNTVEAAFGRFFPRVDLYSEMGLQNYSSPYTRANNTDYWKYASDNRATLTQNLFDGYNRTSEHDRELAKQESARSRLSDTIETVALDAIRAHVDVARQRELIRLAQDNVARHETILQSIKERVDAGAASRADEMQALSRLARARTTLVTYQGELKVAEADYARAVGQAPTELVPPEYPSGLAPVNMEQVAEKALSSNPKINTYSYEITVAQEERDIVGSRMYPTLDLKASTRYTDDLDESLSWIWDNRLMLVVNWNIFNGTTDYYDKKAAEARIHEAEADLNDTVDGIMRLVSTAWAEYHMSIDQVTLYTQALDYSTQSRDMYMQQFNVGQRSLLDVLDAENELFSNAVLLKTAIYNRTYSVYKIQAIQGTLIQAMDMTALVEEISL